MKYRMGFVTNSSSSSFIMNFKSKHSVLEELVNKISMEEYLAKTLASMIQSYGQPLSKKALKKKLEKEVEQVILYENFLKSRDLVYRELSDEDIEKLNERVKQIMDLIEDGTYTVALEVGDETDLGSTLEHDVLPYAQPCVIIHFSHH